MSQFSFLESSKLTSSEKPFSLAASSYSDTSPNSEPKIVQQPSVLPGNKPPDGGKQLLSSLPLQDSLKPSPLDIDNVVNSQRILRRASDLANPGVEEFSGRLEGVSLRQVFPTNQKEEERKVRTARAISTGGSLETNRRIPSCSYMSSDSVEGINCLLGIQSMCKVEAVVSPKISKKLTPAKKKMLLQKLVEARKEENFVKLRDLLLEAFPPGQFWKKLQAKVKKGAQELESFVKKIQVFQVVQQTQDVLSLKFSEKENAQDDIAHKSEQGSSELLFPHEKDLLFLQKKYLETQDCLEELLVLKKDPSLLPVTFQQSFIALYLGMEHYYQAAVEATQKKTFPFLRH
jgi:hypothetical protein